MTSPTPAMEATPALEARAVERIYAGGVRALDGVDLAVAAGETVVLVGESGSGKTTLLRLFNRMVDPSAGEVWVEGRPVDELPATALRRHLGYVQQEGGLLPHWTVEANVALVPRLLGWDRLRRQQRAHEMLALTGLEPGRFATRYPGELSGGQRQRVALARALAADPPIILLDEPFGALDALTRRRLQREVRDLLQRLGKTALLVTHDLQEAELFAYRVAVLRNGRIEQIGAMDELRSAPATEYVARLLGDEGRLQGDEK
ncbi:MAG: ATP-binding cassette domain-containing protein [Acidobacteriota bacterium]